MDRRQLTAWAGMIGPVLFITIFTLKGWLRADYNPVKMYISELSLGPRGWIQIVNFIVFGTLLLVFAFGIITEFRDGKTSRAGPIILMFIAISFLVSGPFVMDPLSTVPEKMSWHGILHSIFGAIVFSLAPMSCFVCFRRFREDQKWRSFKWWTLIAGTIITAAVVVMSIAQKSPLTTPNILNEWAGLIQRIALITFLSWIFSFALGIHIRYIKSK